MCETFNIPDRSLTFRGYANTCFGDGFDEFFENVVGRLSYDHTYRDKFRHFVFHDVYGEEHWFAVWEEFQDWIERNPGLAYGGDETESDVEEAEARDTE
jgi:hypothetical protein